VEKYRPAQLDEVISHKDIIASVSKFIDENKLPHLLFYGPPGTGKTSMILACARKLYGPRYKSMILELNASDDRGIDVVREQIKNFASTKKIFSSGFKLIILDEADAMTQVAQNALRRIVEKYTQNVRFCIICNYVSKIIPALQSRCTRFRFAPINPEFIRTRLDHVVEAENINITESGRKALLKLSKGDMRRMLNILQAVHAAYPVADEVSIYTCVGAPVPGDVIKIADWLFGETFDVAYSNIKALKTDKGLALSDIIGELHSTLGAMQLPPRVRSMLLIKLADVEYNLTVGCSEKIQLASLVGGFKGACDLASNLVG
ncbi:P-loop containing nucleoside triphosphate hydrolase protein, partial [Obelidium mucronatum]